MSSNEKGSSQGEPRRSIQRGSARGGISGKAIAAIAAIVLIAAAAGAYYVLAPPAAKQTQIVQIDGSSTVFPITSAWAGEFNNPDRQVVVAFSGTGGGFQKFCRGETDLSDASRPIKQSERDECASNGITGITEFMVAYDGLSVVINKQNTLVSSLTVKDLCRIWTSSTDAGACDGAGPRATMWSDINSTWPGEKIELYGPGTDSGTFDYFVEVILDPYDQQITDDFFPSEDDNVLVQGVANDVHALGYFGYAYAIENTATIRIVPIDDEDGSNGAGPILPSEGTIKGGSYAPLSRPLFVYANGESLARPVVQDFLRYGYAAEGQAIIAEVGYIALTASEVATQVAKIPA